MWNNEQVSVVELCCAMSDSLSVRDTLMDLSREVRSLRARAESAEAEVEALKVERSNLGFERDRWRNTAKRMKEAQQTVKP